MRSLAAANTLAAGNTLAAARLHTAASILLTVSGLAAARLLTAAHPWTHAQSRGIAAPLALLRDAHSCRLRRPACGDKMRAARLG